MSNQILVPSLGESVAEATVAKWYKAAGDSVTKDEILVELETDKVTLEVNALVSGTLTEIKVGEGDNVGVGDLLGMIEEGEVAAPVKAPEAPKEAAPVASAPAAQPTPANISGVESSGPATRKLVAETGVNAANISGSGKDGRVTKGDVLNALQGGVSPAADSGPREERVKMTKLRQVIAKRLKDSQNTAAILTTFNEIDMSGVMELRAKYKDQFEKSHGVKLGFMSFFTKAAIAALKELPAVNAEIDGDEIVYKNYCNIGMAVGTPQGLVVPVLKDADRMSFADIEKTIAALGAKGRDGKLSMEELQGGTFTISNGGVYGSLLSTPIINPPQSGILGLHKIEDRPMVVNGEVKVRPMMYVALSYDHRIIDGREAVTFLVRIKENIEDPSRLLFDL